MDLHTLLVECAQQEGFPLAGSVDLDLALVRHPSDHPIGFAQHVSHYDHWLKQGFAGGMEYLTRGRDRRADPRLLFPETQSIFCVAIPYRRSAAGAISVDQGPRYARYLQGPDYHIEISQKLERVMQATQSQWNTLPNQKPLTWKVCVDTSAVLERAWAALAGLGWIGKNSLLIHPKLGSYLFLGEVLINTPTGKAPTSVPNYCGNCTRCLNSCPTQALIEPRLLDSTRCIAYWTLEKRGDLGITPTQKEKIGNWIAGCDVCQEVCPFNLKPSRLPERAPFSSHATDLQTWVQLLMETSEEYKIRIKNSAMNRIKPAQFSRNLAIALSNARNSPAEKDSLASLVPLIEARLNSESDPVAQVEWQKCLDTFLASDAEAI